MSTAAVGIAEARFHRGDAVVGEEVGGEHLGVDTVGRGELCRELLESGGVARHEHDVVAARGKTDRRRRDRCPPTRR